MVTYSVRMFSLCKKICKHDAWIHKQQIAIYVSIHIVLKLHSKHEVTLFSYLSVSKILSSCLNETMFHSYVLMKGEHYTMQWCVERMEIGGHWCEQEFSSTLHSLESISQAYLNGRNEVAVTLETPLVWHAARLHLRLSVNLVNDVETLVHIKPYK